MSISAFGDRSQPPVMEEMLAVTGSRRALWETIVKFLDDNCRVRRDLKFYGKSYGWMVQYRHAGKLLMSVYPKRDGLAVQLILSEAQLKAARDLSLGERTTEAIARADHYPEGCWMLLEVESGQEVADIRALMLLKLPPTKKAVRGPA